MESIKLHPPINSIYSSLGVLFSQPKCQKLTQFEDIEFHYILYIIVVRPLVGIRRPRQAVFLLFMEPINVMWVHLSLSHFFIE